MQKKKKNNYTRIRIKDSPGPSIWRHWICKDPVMVVSNYVTESRCWSEWESVKIWEKK